MNTKVKGLLKGLRYISQIFDGKEEQEMQIGYPTDVKHVAHIGWDGPSVNTPTWMNEFHSAPLGTTFGAVEECTTPRGASQGSPACDPSESSIQRRTRRHASADPPGSDSPSRDHSSRGSRHSRRHQSAGSVSAVSPTIELPDGSRRRRQPKTASSENGGSESPSHDMPSIPKQSRRRRAKGSDRGGGSTRLSTRSKDPSFSDPSFSDPSSFSDPGLDEGSTRPVPALTPAAEEL